MPFIRDYAYSTSGSTSSTTATCGVPNYVQNDLLVAVVSADGSLPANTTAVTSSGWTNVRYYSTGGTNACGMNVLVKYATSSEPVDYTFSGLGSDTNNSMIISIGDVFYDGGTGVNAFENLTASTATPNWTGTTYATLRKGYPSITSTNNNSLILYLGVSAGTGINGGVPTCNEGIASLIIGKDGGSHSDGAAWSYKAVAGTQAANTVYMRNSGTTSAAGFIAQMVIKPPAEGATVIPPYIVSDASRLINTGTGAADAAGYGANTTATAANSTMFPIDSLTLNDRPVVAGGTTYTAADQGVNSFHSGLNILGVTTSGSWASNTTAHPAMTDLDGYNILLHVSEATPVLGQPVDSVSLAGACGFAVGLASTAGNCKVWHLHGNGTPWGHNRWIPCVINTSNTSGVIGSAGTLNTNSITNIGAFLSCKGIAGTYTIVSIWKMDRIVVAGGNAFRPFTDADIVPVCADSKERRSVVAQGAKQYYVIQDIQFGNGGTDPIYLNISDAAFEFPKQYNKTTKNTNYCSVDNKVGFTFYPGASDYIDIRNCLFSSSSKYFWGFHASSGAGSVYTDGAKVVGAGTITLAANIPLTGMTFSKCDQITSVGNNLTNIIFDQTNTSTGAFYITGSTQTALQTALDKLSGCTFSNNIVGLRINYTGTGNITLNMSSGIFSGNTKDIRWEAEAGQTLTINKSGSCTVSSAETNNSTTVTIAVSVALTLTNLISGSDIVILDAGTTTERINIDSNSGTSYIYSFNTGGSVDICVYKQGYIPYTVRNYTLPASDGSLPIKQVADRNFFNP